MSERRMPSDAQRRALSGHAGARVTLDGPRQIRDQHSGQGRRPVFESQGPSWPRSSAAFGYALVSFAERILCKPRKNMYACIANIATQIPPTMRLPQGIAR